MQRACLTLVALLVAGAVSAEDPEPGVAPSITPNELHAQSVSGSAPVIVDVRTPEEFASSHIAGAINIPFDEVAERIEEIDAPEGVALYCMVGPRARKGESVLLAAGYDKVFHIEGGLAAWQAAGLPVTNAP
ncbi:MAG: rhodanese-like domain-containing protein [Myxococcota bacterium]